MAIKNIKLTYVPTNLWENKIEFSTGGTNYQIPFRYPFEDIANYNELKNAGIFRAETKEVSKIFGEVGTDKNNQLGFALPRVENVFLIAQKGAAGQETITIKGAEKHGTQDAVIKLQGGQNDLTYINLTQHGLYVQKDGNILIDTQATVKLGLVCKD